jgi:hypothetical protein
LLPRRDRLPLGFLRCSGAKHDNAHPDEPDDLEKAEDVHGVSRGGTTEAIPANPIRIPSQFMALGRPPVRSAATLTSSTQRPPRSSPCPCGYQRSAASPRVPSAAHPFIYRGHARAQECRSPSSIGFDSMIIAWRSERAVEICGQVASTSWNPLRRSNAAMRRCVATSWRTPAPRASVPASVTHPRPFTSSPPSYAPVGAASSVPPSPVRRGHARPTPSGTGCWCCAPPTVR